MAYVKAYTRQGAEFIADITAEGATQVAAVQAEGATQTANAAAQATIATDQATISTNSAQGSRRSLSTAFATTDETIGDTTSDTNTLTSTDFSYGPPARTLKSGYLKTISVRLSATGTGAFMICDAGGRVIHYLAVTVSTIPQSFDYTGQLLWVPAGCTVHYRQLTGGGLRSVNASGNNLYITNTSYDGSTNDPVTLTYNTGTVSVSMVVTSLDDGRVIDRVGAVEAAADADDVALRQRMSFGSQPSQNWTNFDGYRVGYDAGTDIPVGTPIDRLECEVLTPATGAYYRLAVVRRSTASANIETAPMLAEDVLIYSATKAIADLSLTAGASALETLRLTIPRFDVKAGYTYFVTITCFTSAWATVGFGIGYDALVTTRQRRRGWYNASATAVSSGFSVGLRLSGNVWNGELSYDDRIISVDFSYAGLAITTSIVFSRNGVRTTYSDTRTMTAAASNFRYDLLVFDRSTLTFALVAGTDASDAMERIPSISTSTQMLVAHLRVTTTAVRPIARHDRLADGTLRRLAAQAREDDNRNRQALARFRARIASGATLRIVGLGDSIIAQQNSTTSPSTTTPNGATRDCAASSGTTLTYLRDALTATVVDAVPLYTAVQLGRADDGAGAVHTRTSYIWEMVDELEKMGRTLGTDLFYDNFGIAGQTSTGLVTNGLTTPAATTWLTSALGLGAHLAVLNLGMNADASIAVTRANVAYIIQQFRAVNCDVVVMGRALKRSYSSDLTTWQDTNLALRDAAEANGAAFISTRPLYDSAWLGMGIAQDDICSANANNHPGLWEHKRLGDPLRRAVRL